MKDGKKESTAQEQNKKNPKPKRVNKLAFLLTSAHQVRSPLTTADTSLMVLLQDYAGALSAKQRMLVESAERKVRLGLSLVNDMLAINKLLSGNVLDAFEAVDLSQLTGKVTESLSSAAKDKGVEFLTHVKGRLPTVWAHPEGIRSIIYNLLDNAIRYTPRTGRVDLSLSYDSEKNTLLGEVSDTGIGIPTEYHEMVLEDFYRAPNAKNIVVTGTGLGLSIVRKSVELHGGSLEFKSKPGSKTTFNFSLPLAQISAKTLDNIEKSKKRRMRIIVIGGVAAGPKAAAKARRMDPRAEVIIVERGMFLSYAGCGLPYYISGQVADQKDLMTSPIGENRDPEFFKLIKDIVVMSPAEAISIDREHKLLEVRSRDKTRKLPYDKLIIATGSTPVLPKIDGIRKKNVFTLHGVEDAEGLKRELMAEESKDAVIIGGGPLGIELAEALTVAGARVTVLEARHQILGMLDFEMAALVRRHLESKGVRILTDIKPKKIEGKSAVSGVVIKNKVIPADLVISAAGLLPNVNLAKEAGIKIGPTGSIEVNEFLQTNDPDIFAAGDCAENQNIITGKKSRSSLASIANRQGRVAGINAAGGHEQFSGSIRAMVFKVFDFHVGSSGLTEREAVASGLDVESVIVPGPDRAHYYPTSKMLFIKLIADKKDGRLLGAQVLGPGEASKRLDVVTAMLSQHASLDELSKLDHSFAPPYSTALDCLTVAANVLRNKLEGLHRTISSIELKKKLDRGDNLFLLDVRTPHDHERHSLPGSRLMPLAALHSCMNELPREKEIVIICELGSLAYEAALILQANAFSNVVALDGGLAAWPYPLGK